MIKYENWCVGCPQGCVHCGNKHVKVYICDRCKEQIEVAFDGLYTLPGYDDLCRDCLLELCEKEDVGE